MNIRIVILECPYDVWDIPQARDLFTGLVALKFSGYRQEYPYGVLPVDTSDFVCSHHMVCEETAMGLRPVMGYRSLSMERTKIHNLAFPALTMTKSLNLYKHSEAVEQVLRRCEMNGKNLAYDSSWTIAPDVRQDRDLTKYLRSVMTALHTLYHVENGTDEILSGGALKFKMEKLFTFWGYAPIALNGEELSSFELPSYFNAPIILFHQQNGFSEEAREEARIWQGLWDNRLVIQNKDALKDLKISA